MVNPSDREDQRFKNRPSGNCPTCTIPYANHPRCTRCSIFIGPGHIIDDYVTIMGTVLCVLCANDLATRERVKR